VGGPALGAAVIAKVVGSAPASAGTEAGCPVTIAGPTQAVRAKGEPRLDTFAFSSPYPSERHVLRIDNGGVTGAMPPVTSATVELNGRQLRGPNRFKPQVRTIEQQIEVDDANQLGFRLAGQPNSGLSFKVFAIDSQPPDFVAVSPDDGSVVSEPQVTLVVTLDDALSGPTSLHCGGIEATPVDGVFACTVPLAAGANAIELVAADAWGNERSEVVTIEFDPPPVVTISSPEDGDEFKGGPVVVAGTVDEPDASVTVNGVPATGRPNFTATVPVRKGLNTLVAVARDANGSESSDSVEIMVLSGVTGPIVSITSPKSDFLVGTPALLSGEPRVVPVSVSGTVRAVGGSGTAPTVEVSTADVGPVAASVTLRKGQSPHCLNGNTMCDYDFHVGQIALDKANNPHSIRAVATDYLGYIDEDTVGGNADWCRSCLPNEKGECTRAANGNAVKDAAKGQSNLCHYIDGCSAPSWAGGQDPTDGKLNKPGTSTAFGRDESENPTVHGLGPTYKLPCNRHDVCYQTCGASKVACDDAMLVDMTSVCRSAYPEKTCPYQPNIVKCTQWRDERAKCYAQADKYRNGLRIDKWYEDRFGRRQDEFCY
jgi:hypothetical protein